MCTCVVNGGPAGCSTVLEPAREFLGLQSDFATNSKTDIIDVENFASTSSFDTIILELERSTLDNMNRLVHGCVLHRPRSRCNDDANASSTWHLDVHDNPILPDIARH